ncbi:MAG: hypothetical protein GWP08_11825 [Nitrospiraceae bacterium]|nr:hypothetical protein [Nitrospiraceae bacterium]
MFEPGRTASEALSQSWSIQSTASALGFDWPDITGVFAKVLEEVQEVQHAWDEGDYDHAKRELGDVLFAVVNLARFLNADPGDELHRANERFNLRFSLLKEQLKCNSIKIEDCTLEELDAVWEQVKKALRETGENVAEQGAGSRA